MRIYPQQAIYHLYDYFVAVSSRSVHFVTFCHRLCFIVTVTVDLLHPVTQVHERLERVLRNPPRDIAVIRTGLLGLRTNSRLRVSPVLFIRFIIKFKTMCSKRRRDRLDDAADMIPIFTYEKRRKKKEENMTKGERIEIT